MRRFKGKWVLKPLLTLFIDFKSAASLKKGGTREMVGKNHTVNDVEFAVFGKGIFAATQFRVID